MKLPAGWTSEDVKHSDGDYIVIRRPDGHVSLSVTIDLKRREFRAGYAMTGPMLSHGTYSGRGWRDYLINAAVEWILRV
jgi:hypothetical protein